jgi:hypothetical protein
LLPARWGFKRCEDICWIKTNQQHKSRKYLIPTYQQEGSMLVHTKVGLVGQVYVTVQQQQQHNPQQLCTIAVHCR